MDENKSNELFDRVYIQKIGTEEERALVDEHSRQRKQLLADYEEIYKAALLISPLVEKTMIVFNHPYLVMEYDYDRDSAFSADGINDLRYLKQEEIDHLKEEGYDSIAVRQYQWFIQL